MVMMASIFIVMVLHEGFYGANPSQHGMFSSESLLPRIFHADRIEWVLPLRDVCVPWRCCAAKYPIHAAVNPKHHLGNHVRARACEVRGLNQIECFVGAAENVVNLLVPLPAGTGIEPYG